MFHSVTNVRKLPITQSCRKSTLLRRSTITDYEYCIVDILSLLTNKEQLNQRNKSNNLRISFDDFPLRCDNKG